MTFFSHHPLLHGHIRHILPPTTFVSHLWGCTSPDSAPFCLIPTKKCRPGGAPAPPGYAYVLPCTARSSYQIQLRSAVEQHFAVRECAKTVSRIFNINRSVAALRPALTPGEQHFAVDCGQCLKGNRHAEPVGWSARIAYPLWAWKLHCRLKVFMSITILCILTF